MSKLIYIITLLIAFQTRATNQCQSLFSEAMEDSLASTATYLRQENSMSEASQLLLTPSDFSYNPNKSAIEIIKLSLVSSSFSMLEKNYLNKDKISLGFNLSDGMTLEVSYASNSKFEDQFIIDQINLRSATGYKFKVAENLMKEHEFELKSDRFDVTKLLNQKINIELKVPLIIHGQTLTQLAQHAKSFELFTKDELRTLYLTKNEKQISRAVFIRKAKDLFYKVLVKEPFKILIGGAMMFGVMQIGNNAPPLVLPQTQIQQTTTSAQVESFHFTHKDKSGAIVTFEVVAQSTSKPNQINYAIKRIK